MTTRSSENAGVGDLVSESILASLARSAVSEAVGGGSGVAKPEGSSQPLRSVTTITEAYVGEPKKFMMPAENLSERAKAAHRELYAGYVGAMNQSSAELDSIDRSSPGQAVVGDYASLKRKETFNLNASWLHELYFSAGFDPRSEIHQDSKAMLRLERDFGNFDDWQRDFIACALSVGEGWAVMGYSTYLRRYVNCVVSGHSNDVPIGLHPILVLDMFSHSYYRDYLNDRKNYIASSMLAIDWQIIETRVEVAERIAAAVGGMSSTTSVGGDR